MLAIDVIAVRLLAAPLTWKLSWSLWVLRKPLLREEAFRSEQNRIQSIVLSAIGAHLPPLGGNQEAVSSSTP